MFCLAFFFLTILTIVQSQRYTDNINGTYTVFSRNHYSNKTAVTWGQNGELSFNVTVSMSLSCATYNCSSTCDDTIWYYDWNKLWGKARCGYAHDHHEDSDRFVWRRCSDPTCAAYIRDKNMIQIAGYSYDNGLNPYADDPVNLLKQFDTLIEPDVKYILKLTVNDMGLTTYGLLDAEAVLIEQQQVQHNNTCVDNYFEGELQGLYFGGTCRAPVDVTVIYES